jgi:hypothetical protein
MSGLEIVVAVANIVAGFGTGFELFRRWKKRRALQSDGSNVETSLNTSGSLVQSEYDSDFARLGPRFAIGDGMAIIHWFLTTAPRPRYREKPAPILPDHAAAVHHQPSQLSRQRRRDVHPTLPSPHDQRHGPQRIHPRPRRAIPAHADLGRPARFHHQRVVVIIRIERRRQRARSPQRAVLPGGFDQTADGDRAGRDRFFLLELQVGSRGIPAQGKKKRMFPDTTGILVGFEGLKKDLSHEFAKARRSSRSDEGSWDESLLPGLYPCPTGGCRTDSLPRAT